MNKYRGYLIKPYQMKKSIWGRWCVQNVPTCEAYKETMRGSTNLITPICNVNTVLTQ